MSRWIRFFIVIAIGVGAGLLYGWVINPVEYVDTTPASLRDDYKADYVLMVAEVYRHESELAFAARRLALLGDVSPLESVKQAIHFASQEGYSLADLTLMRELRAALQSWYPSIEAPSP